MRRPGVLVIDVRERDECNLARRHSLPAAEGTWRASSNRAQARFGHRC
jgi:hypothetical protein